MADLEIIGARLVLEDYEAFQSKLKTINQAILDFGTKTENASGIASKGMTRASASVSEGQNVWEKFTPAVGQAHTGLTNIVQSSEKVLPAFSKVGQSSLSLFSDFSKLGKDGAGLVIDGLGKAGDTALKAVEGFAKLGLEATKAAGTLATKFVKSSVGAFAEFDQSLNTIRATASDVDDKVFKQLQDSAIEFGAKLPLSTKQVADGFVELSKAGFSADQILKGLGGATANLAVAGNLEVGKSADILGSALRDFGKDAKDADHFAAVLAGTANASAVDITDMNESLKYAGPIANAAGISFEETSNYIGIMGNNMIKGSQAGTSLRSVITRVTTGAGHAGEAMAALGVSTTDSSGKMKPFSDIMTELRTKFAGLSEDQQLNYANQIAGQSAMTGFITLMKASSKDMNDMSTAIAGSDKQFSNLTNTMQGSLGTKFENFKGSIEAVQIRLGRALAPAASQVVDALSNMTNTLGPLADKLGGPVLSAMALAHQSFISLYDGFVTGTLAGNNFQRMLGKIGNTTFESLDFAKESFISLYDGFVTGTLAGNDFQRTLGKIGNAVYEIGPKFLAVATAFNPLSLALTAFQGFVSGGVNGAIDALSMKLNQAGRAVGLDLGTPLNMISDFIKTGAIPIFDSLGKVFQNDIMPAVGLFVQNALPPLLNAFKGVAAFLADPFLPVFGKIASFIIGTVLPTVIDLGTTFITALLPAFTVAVNFVGQTLLPKFQELFGWFQREALPTIKDMATSIGSVLVEAFKVLGPVISVAFDIASTAFKVGFAIFKTGFEVIKTIALNAGNIFTTFGNIVKGVFDGLVFVIKLPLNAVIGALNGIILGINTVMDGINIVSPIKVGPHISNIPFLAEGGIATGPMQAVIGEAGSEAVLPLKQIVPLISEGVQMAAKQVSPAATAQQMYSNHAYNNSSTTYAPNYNLNVNSMRSSESVATDFRTLMTLAG